MSKLTVETDKYGLVRVKVETTKSGTPITYRAPANTGLSGQNDQAIAAIVGKINEMDTIQDDLDTSLEKIESVIPEDTSEGNKLVNEKRLLHDAGVLTDAASIDITNNATQRLTSTQTALTLNVNFVAGEVPNFAVEINASSEITLTLTKTVNEVPTTLYPSKAGGTTLESGKFYQVTCVGNCWTLAEFEASV